MFVGLPISIIQLHIQGIRENVKISKESFYTICQFAKGDLSIYQICKTLESTPFKTDYKNVHKKVHKFLSLGWIEEVKKTENLDDLHKAKYYRLTTLGIICIFFNSQELSLLTNKDNYNSIYEIMKSLLKNYLDDEFFRFFSEPYFEKDIILKINSKAITKFLLDYFMKCAYQAYSILFENKWRYENEIGDLFTNIVKNEKDIDNNLVNEVRDNKIFNDLIIYELENERLNVLEKTMILPIIQEGRYWSKDIKKYKRNKQSTKPFNVSHWIDVEKDLNLLVNDKKFCSFIDLTKKGIDDCYKNIMKLKI